MIRRHDYGTHVYWTASHRRQRQIYISTSKSMIETVDYIDNGCCDGEPNAKQSVAESIVHLFALFPTPPLWRTPSRAEWLRLQKRGSFFCWRNHSIDKINCPFGAGAIPAPQMLKIVQLRIIKMFCTLHFYDPLRRRKVVSFLVVKSPDRHDQLFLKCRCDSGASICSKVLAYVACDILWPFGGQKKGHGVKILLAKSLDQRCQLFLRRVWIFHTTNLFTIAQMNCCLYILVIL